MAGVDPFKMRLLITGGSRSGKSLYAEERVLEMVDAPVYLATSVSDDFDFQKRVARHQARRDDRWTTREKATDLAGHVSASESFQLSIEYGSVSRFSWGDDGLRLESLNET